MESCDGGAAELLQGTWSIEETSLAGAFAAGQVAALPGNVFQIHLSTPAEVGVYSLRLELRTDADGAGDPPYVVTRKLLVTHRWNRRLLWWWLSTPKREWYEKACTWAAGGTSDEDVLERLLDGMHAHGQAAWEYVAVRIGDDQCAWSDLVEDGSGCKQQQCFGFSEVFESLANVLGIGSLISKTCTAGAGCNMLPGSTELPFATVQGLSSIDPAFPGNARYGAVDFDRYVFASHSLRSRGDTHYDATFNEISTHETAADFMELTADSRIQQSPTCWQTVEGPQICVIGAMAEPHTWSLYEITLPASPAPPGSPGPEGASMELLEPAVEGSAAAAPAFTGASFRTEGAGPLWDTLIAEIDVELTETDAHGISGELLSGDTVVASLPRFFSASATGAYLEADPGTHTVELAFSGEQIHRSGLDGPYTVRVSSGAASTGFATPAYAFDDFGELGAEITGVHELPVDTDANGATDEVHVTAALEVRIDDTYHLEAALLDGGETITTAGASFGLAPGSHEVVVPMPGAPLHHAAGDGVYELVVNLYRDDGEKQGGLTATTAALTASDFEAFLEPQGPVTDEGIDTDGDGRLDVLRVSFDAEVAAAGTYLVTGLLTDASGQSFAFGLTEQVLAAGTQSVSIEFPGLLIGTHGIDGPYTLTAIEILDPDGQPLDRVPLDHTTASYDHADFDDGRILDPLCQGDPCAPHSWSPRSRLPRARTTRASPSR